MSSAVDPNVTVTTHESSASASIRRAVALLSGSWLGDVLLLSGFLVGVVVIHLAIPGVVPTGADGGYQLALANELRGQGVMSAEVAYPPLFPALLALLLQVGVPPIGALVALALLAKIALVVAVFLTTRTLNRILATTATILAATAAAQLETYAWGGYPQLLGMALGLVSVFLIVRYVDTQESRHLWWGVGLGVAAIATHVMIGWLLVAAVGVAVAHWLYMVDPRRRVWERGLRTGAAVFSGGGIVAIVAFLLWGGLSSEASLNPLSLSRWEAVTYVFRDAPLLWALVFVGAVVVLFFRYWPAHVSSTIAVASSWALASVVFFLVSGGATSLPIFQIGLILLATVGLGAASESIVGPWRVRHSTAPTRSLWQRLPLVAVGSVLFAIVAAGLGAYASAVDWYRLVDRAELSALDSLQLEAEPGDLVVAARGLRGMPVGWWVEGYGEVSAYSGHDIRFLAFPDEREQAEIANSIFSEEFSDTEIQAALREIGADYLIVDRRGPDAAFLDGDLARSLPVIDDLSQLVILDSRGVNGD